MLKPDSVPIGIPSLIRDEQLMIWGGAHAKVVIIELAVGALVFELVAPPLEQIYTKPKQLGLVLENPY